MSEPMSESSKQPDPPGSAVLEMPMFPLGSVLFPRGTLPLHIFELRYQQMLNHVLETDRCFGVTLITRGSEVGGGEARSTIGTVATIDDYQRFDDGRAAVVCTGTERLQVVEWLEDDPYPRAHVRRLGRDVDGDNDQALFDQAIKTFDELIELGHRLGRLESRPESTWETDIDEATWQLAGRAPCTAHDQYRVLAAPSRAARLQVLDELLHDVYTDLELMGGLSES